MQDRLLLPRRYSICIQSQANLIYPSCFSHLPLGLNVMQKREKGGGKRLRFMKGIEIGRYYAKLEKAKKEKRQREKKTAKKKEELQKVCCIGSLLNLYIRK